MNEKFKAMCICAFLSMMALLSFAQKVQVVHGAYTYLAPLSQSVSEAKRVALERAKIQALADAFGTNVMQRNVTSMGNENGISSIDFNSLSSSEVKGEWIETIGEPIYDDIMVKDNMLVVRVKVKGKARRIDSAGVDLDLRVLRNGTDPKFQSQLFYDGDDLYLYAKSPIDGFMAVYLYAESEGMVYCLLPYASSSVGAYRIEHDVPYCFFSIKDAREGKDDVDEYVMTCSKDAEYNDLYIVFSPNEFYKSNTTSANGNMPREIPFSDYQKWLSKCKNADSKMQVTVMSITIKHQ